MNVRACLGVAVLVGSVFAVGGCGPMGPVNYGGGPSQGTGASAQFSPYSAVRSDPSTRDAIRIYEGDRNTLRSAGATFVGDLDVDAQQQLDLPFNQKRQNYDGLAPRAAMEAAKVGATHFILVEAGVDVKQYTVQNAEEETQSQVTYDQYGNKHVSSVTTHRPEQTIQTSAQRAHYALFRVDPTHWNELPAALRPVPLETVATTTVTSAPAPTPAADAAPAPAPTPAPVSTVALPRPSPKTSSKAAIKKAGY